MIDADMIGMLRIWRIMAEPSWVSSGFYSSTSLMFPKLSLARLDVD